MHLSCLLGNGCGARIVMVNLKQSEMSTPTRSVTLPCPTTQDGVLVVAGSTSSRDRPPSQRGVVGVK